MSELIKAVNDADFATEVLQSKRPVLVDFWAEWCGPCRMIAPVLDMVAAEFGDRVKIVKVDVDQNPQLVSQYGVRGIPNLLLIKDGNVVANKGPLTKSQLVTLLNEHC